MVFHEEARKIIARRRGTKNSDWDFDVRSKTHPEECPPYYQANKPCHGFSREGFNCYLCLCPGYNLDVEEGGCNFGNPQGKGYLLDKPDGKRIWDCSSCTFPHEKEKENECLRRFKEILNETH